MRWTLLCILLILICASCQREQISTPRPHQYPRVDLPAKEYKEFSSEGCPFSMQIPMLSVIEKKSQLFDDVPTGPCWFNLVLEPLNATIHCSYYSIDQERSLDNLVNDAYTMASKHNQKASYREEYILKNKNGNQGLIFEINGPVATPYQFYISDSTQHFLRGSLYFDDKVDYDSIAPLLTFIKEDVDKMLYTLDWK